MKCTAQWTEEELKKANIEEWSAQWRRRKWKWDVKLADPENGKWSATITKWQPWLHSQYLCSRRQARPKRRWDQDFLDYLKSDGTQTKEWFHLAREKKWWTAQTDAFAKHCV